MKRFNVSREKFQSFNETFYGLHPSSGGSRIMGVYVCVLIHIYATCIQVESHRFTKTSRMWF